jgi:hypothetical protein
MSDQAPVKMQGTLMNAVYSPTGGIEGLLLETNGVVMQLAFAHGDEASVAPAAPTRRRAKTRVWNRWPPRSEQPIRALALCD